MTNNEFAEILGCHHSMASRIRSGERLPGANRLRAISLALDVSLDELLGAYEDGPEEFGKLIRSRIRSLSKAAASAVDVS